jgi:sugar lactone lactonase YvrE
MLDNTLRRQPQALSEREPQTSILVKADGAVYFTDAAAGCLHGREDIPEKELPFHGVYCVKSGKLRLLAKDPDEIPPNGIAFPRSSSLAFLANTRPRIRPDFGEGYHRDAGTT